MVSAKCGVVGPYSKVHREELLRQACLMKYSDSVSITGPTASGKTALFGAIKARLRGNYSSYLFVSAGEVMMKIGKSKGFSDKESFAKHIREHPHRDYDNLIDQEVVRLTRRNFVFSEGRLVHVYSDMSFHCLIKCPAAVRSHRRFKYQNPTGKTYAEVLAGIEGRDENDRVRYAELRPGSLWPESDYDVVIDTGVHTPDQCAEILLTAHSKWREVNRDRLWFEAV